MDTSSKFAIYPDYHSVLFNSAFSFIHSLYLNQEILLAVTASLFTDFDAIF